jgi:hypothetical protein
MESNTKKYLLIGIALVCTHALAFATGRYMTPEKIIETEKIKVVEVEKQIVVVQEKIKIERVIVQNEEQRIHREEH